jgi:rubrerythrin
MGLHFNAEEILSMAERMERNGARFYRKAAQHAADPRIRDRLLALATMEEDHQKTFASLKGALGRHERGDATFDPDDDGHRYLESLADGKVFDTRKDPAESLTGKETIREVFLVAMGMEKDSVVFYSGLRDLVGAAHGRDRVDTIIREELGHLADLSRELERLPA